MTGQLLMARAGAPFIAKCEQNVWRRMWTPGFTFARRAARFIQSWTIFWVSGDRSASS